MQSEYVVLTKEEYREMLTYTLRVEIEKEVEDRYKDKINDLISELDSTRSSSTYWFETAQRFEATLDALKNTPKGDDANG